MVTYTSNPNTLGGGGRRMTWGQVFGRKEGNKEGGRKERRRGRKKERASELASQAQWLVPVIPALGRPWWVDHKVRSSRPAWPTWWNLVSAKNTKISQTWWCTCNLTYLGAWGRRIAWTWEVEVAVSQDGTTAFQPGWQSKTLSQEKKKNVYVQKEIHIHALQIISFSFMQLPHVYTFSKDSWMCSW